MLHVAVDIWARLAECSKSTMTHGIQSKITRISLCWSVIRKCSQSKAARSGRGLLIFREARQSRSTSQNLLFVPKTKCVTFGDRAFSVFAPSLWNTLPLTIRSADSVDSFKSQVKTFLFRKYFV